MEAAPEPIKVQSVFRKWDAGGKGLIKKSDLKCVIQKLLPGITSADLDVLFAEVDAQGDANLNYIEFIDYLWSGTEAEAEAAAERAREKGLWEGELIEARTRTKQKYPADKVDRYFDEVQERLGGAAYAEHVKGAFFTKTDKNADERISFEEASALILKSLQFAADLGSMSNPPSKAEIKAAFDAHDTKAFGRGTMGGDEFLQLCRYLQVRVAEAALPLSKVMQDS